MAILKHFKRLQYLNFLISKRATGNLKTFARKNHLSKSGLAAILSEMKELGFPIKFSRVNNSYYYEKSGEMVSCLFVNHDHVLSKEDKKSINTNVDNLCFSKISVFEECADK